MYLSNIYSTGIGFCQNLLQKNKLEKNEDFTGVDFPIKEVWIETNIDKFSATRFNSFKWWAIPSILSVAFNNES